MGAKIGVLLNCGQQSQFSKVRREFDAGRVNLDPPMTCADWPVPGNLTLLHPQTAYTRKPLHRDLCWEYVFAAGVARVSDRRIVSTCCFAVVIMCILYVSMFTMLLFLCISIDCRPIYSFDLRTLLTYYCVYFVTRWRLITPVC